MASATTIRAARAGDQASITALVRGARLNPRDLAWQRFLVADDGGRVVGCVQVRVHGRGTREVASVVVAPSHRAAGLGTRLVEAVLAREAGALYLFTQTATVAYFERFGFRPVGSEPVPADLRSAQRMTRLVVPFASLVARRRVRIELMVRQPVEAG